jgi:Flp pilus assembly pilin Flp
LAIEDPGRGRTTDRPQLLIDSHSTSRPVGNPHRRENTMKAIARFLRTDEGLESVEYAIIAGLMVAGLVAVITAVGQWVHTTWTTFQGAMGA